MNITDKEQCNNCKFYRVRGEGKEQAQLCVRYPPLGYAHDIPVQNPLSGQVGIKVNSMGYWPTTRHDAWCGEFRPKAEA